MAMDGRQSGGCYLAAWVSCRFSFFLLLLLLFVFCLYDCSLSIASSPTMMAWYISNIDYPHIG